MYSSATFAGFQLHQLPLSARESSKSPLVSGPSSSMRRRTRAQSVANCRVPERLAMRARRVRA